MTKPTEKSMKKLRQIQNRTQLNTEYNQMRNQLLKGTGSVHPFDSLPLYEGNPMEFGTVIKACFVNRDKNGNIKDVICL